MLKPTPQALAAAVNALYRIRAVEGPRGPDDRKTVWHQCALGAELVSTVDGAHVVRQELTLIQSHFIWTSEHGLVTGQVVKHGPKVVANAGQVMELDEQVSSERLDEALAAFSGYQGDDRYLQHIVKVMRFTRDGLPTDEEDSVTGVEPAGGAGGLGRGKGLKYAVAALVLALGAAAAALLR